MLATLRRPALTRALTTTLLAATAAVLPGTTPAAAGSDLTATSRVVPGTVLRPLPPAVVLPVNHYRLTGRFGERSGLWSTVHTGLDFAAPSGTPIRSVAAGTVEEAGYAGAYGYRTVVRLDDGTRVWYCHQSSVDVAAGDPVRVGQRIGTIGSTGNVTGPHLHLEVRPRAGTPVDPLGWLEAQGVRA
ncbi:MAG TPA: M23 family metallopeptidase [Marmoricola sp.]|nr:M23 family metallopeptidase [Marmoricola sp.]